MRKALLATACAVVAISAFIQFAWADQVRFDGQKVVRIHAGTTDEVDLALSLTDDLWSEGAGVGDFDMRVWPEQYAALQASGLSYDVLIDDLQQTADEVASGGGIAGGPLANYMSLGQVNSYLDQLAAQRPDIAQVVTLGTSLQNRPIRGLRITGPGGGTKPGVFFHGGQHAREWITVAVMTYIADRLVTTYDTDPFVHELVNRDEWFIVPVMNPDGYDYTWTNDRLWRKNRRANSDGSFGVDLNRNWGYQWGGQGASSAPNNDTYRGTAPFSEPETQVFSNWVIAHPNIVAYCDLHSYSELIMWAWGYTSALPPDEALFEQIGGNMVSLVEAEHGIHYTAGPIYTTIYPASGTSVDWAYGARNVKAITIESRDTGQYGFLLPADQIIPTGEELFAGLAYYADFMTAAVQIDFPNGLPTTATPLTPTQLTVRVTPLNEAVNPASVRVVYRISSAAPWETLTASPAGGNLYTVSLPGRGCGAATEFYFLANGQSGSEVRSPALSQGAASYSMAIGTQTLFLNDNFETDQGWTVSSDAGLTDGAWQRGVPAGGGLRGDPPADYDGSGQCYLTANRSGNSDVDGGTTWLVSPTINLSSGDAQVRYALWYTNDQGGAPNSDVFRTYISNNNGSTWVTAETIGPQTPGAAWFVHTFNVSQFVTPTATVRLRFEASDLGTGSVVEAGVDAVSVSRFACNAGGRVGDLNCDGLVNNFDITPFVMVLTDPAGYHAAFPNCPEQNADVNGDGAVNNFDIDVFVSMLIG